ncbi:hypothetical protein CSA08_01590 [Candidatus Gracilibacteria bacterium]|nr:MAG: hypothetical protein CSA08_01590 [Candidatus Gracilibacteria bacterium]
MRYLCTNCNYIYDEIIGDIDLGIEGGTKYDDLPYSFCCPVCMEGKEHFSAIVEEVYYLDGKSKYKSGIEREHMIFYKLEDEVLYVNVGGDSHSYSEEHYIMNISIFDEYGDLIEEHILTKDDNPETTFEDFDFDEVEVRITCSLHGVWGIKLKF